MASVILNVTFDCGDPAAVARFWGEATGLAVDEHPTSSGQTDYSVGPASGAGIRLYFVGVPEPKVAKNRIHLDLIPPGTDPRAEVERLVRLGATVPERQPPGAPWLVMADPEGNEFCLELAGSGQ